MDTYILLFAYYYLIVGCSFLSIAFFFWFCLVAVVVFVSQSCVRMCVKYTIALSSGDSLTKFERNQFFSLFFILLLLFSFEWLYCTHTARSCSVVLFFCYDFRCCCCCFHSVYHNNKNKITLIFRRNQTSQIV